MDSQFQVKITADISELQSRLKSVEAITEKFKQSMDRAADSTKNMEQNANRGRMVAFAFGQVIRDAGFFANSFSLGILAISNNIPILIDQLALSIPALSGMAGTLSLIGSLLTAGLTIWAYSSDAVKKNQQSIEEWRSSLADVTEIQLKGKQAALEESASLDILYRAATNAANSNKTRTQAAKELQELYPAIFGNLDTEAIKLGKAKKSYDDLKIAITETAMAEAAKNKIVENSSRILDQETRIREERTNRIKLGLDLFRQEAAAAEEFARASQMAAKTPGKENDGIFLRYERLQKIADETKAKIAASDKIIYNATSDINILNGRNVDLVKEIDRYSKSYVNNLSDTNTELDKAQRQTLDWKLYAKDTGSEFKSIFSAIKGKEVKQFSLFPPDLGTAEKRQLKDFILYMEQFEQQITDIFVNGIGNIISQSFMGIGDAIVGGTNVGKAALSGFLSAMSSMLQQLGEGIIRTALETGTLAIAIGKAVAAIRAALKNMNPLVAIAAGAALIALAGAARKGASNIANNGSSGFGGAESSPTPTFGGIGSPFVNTSMTAGSSVASMFTSNPVLETRVSGNDLVILMDRANKNRNGYF